MGLFDAFKNFLSTSSRLADYWLVPEDASDLFDIKEQSYKHSRLLYRHSLRCGACNLTRNHGVKAAEQIHEEVEFHLVDVLGNRITLNRIAEKWGVPHVSPKHLRAFSVYWS